MTGDKGLTGERGKDGERGPIGIFCIHSHINVKTASYEMKQQIFYLQNLTMSTFKITLFVLGPAGEKGEQGIRGESGEKGEKGNDGERGEPGLIGPRGYLVRLFLAIHEHSHGHVLPLCWLVGSQH